VLVDHDPEMTVAGGTALAARPQPRVAPGAEKAPVTPASPAVVGAPPSWPEIADGRRVVPERPPRPPVRLAPVRTEPAK
jgi:hypothetical protein